MYQSALALHPSKDRLWGYRLAMLAVATGLLLLPVTGGWLWLAILPALASCYWLAQQAVKPLSWTLLSLDHQGYFRVLPSMRFAHFSELMKNAAMMVGNSSAGVREAPFLGIPSIDIGTRQTNRASAPSIRALKASDGSGISEFIETNWGKRFPPHTAFGEGRAADRFVEVISDPDFWDRGLQKEFKDIG